MTTPREVSMDTQLLQAVITKLEKLGVRATLEYPGWIWIWIPLDDDTHLNVGDANGYWGADHENHEHDTLGIYDVAPENSSVERVVSGVVELLKELEGTMQ